MVSNNEFNNFVRWAKKQIADIPNLVIKQVKEVLEKTDKIVIGNADTVDSKHASDFASSQVTWVYPTLLNGWENYNEGWQTFRYCKDGMGFITLSGLIRHSGTVSDSPIINLPIGARPSGSLIFTIMTSGGTARLDIGSQGDVIFRTGESGFVSLDGVRFYVGQ